MGTCRSALCNSGLKSAAISPSNKPPTHRQHLTSTSTRTELREAESVLAGTPPHHGRASSRTVLSHRGGSHTRLSPLPRHPSRPTNPRALSFRSLKLAKVNSLALLREMYHVSAIAGKGSFSQVYVCQDRETGEQVAVKRVKTAVDSSGSRPSAAAMALVNKEGRVLERVRGNRHVVQVLHHFEDRTGAYVVQEYCEGGDLMKYIRSCESFSEAVASRLFLMMATGVAHCHRRLVAHRDLKPDNFLFLSRTGTAHLKVADFGLAEVLDSPDSIMTAMVGTAYFVAPEVLSRKYTLQCDLWSLGVNLYLMLCGSVPFGASLSRSADVFRAVLNDPLEFNSPTWAKIGPAARDLVAGLLDRSPTKRYKIEEVLAHPWVRGESPKSTIPFGAEVLGPMMRFHNQNLFRKQALRLAASTLSSNDIQRLRTTFNAIDTDASQTISFAELSEGMQRLGVEVTSAEIQTIFSALDADSDGSIDLEEFLTCTTESKLARRQAAIWYSFCYFDKNSDGTITLDELREALGPSHDPELVAQWMSCYDEDGNGAVSYDEFMRMCIPAGGPPTTTLPLA